eukprot:5970304-Prymnesium_polylepis.1
MRLPLESWKRDFSASPERPPLGRSVAERVCPRALVFVLDVSCFAITFLMIVTVLARSPFGGLISSR